MSDLFGGGGSTTTVTNTTPPPSQQELDLIELNKQLAQKQLDSINTLAPFQQQLLESSMAELKRNAAVQDAYLKAFPPEQQAALAKQQADLQAQGITLSQQDMAMRKQELEQAQKNQPLNDQITQENLGLIQQQLAQGKALGPLQQQLMETQLKQLQQGNMATPEQLAAIKNATDTAIAAGTGDINTQTQRGIGLISDELANSRGLRLSDSPITSEAALLSRAGSDQVTSLIKNLRANEANATLNYPLAVAGLSNQTLQNQNAITNASQNFQDTLANRAYQNRLALTGSPSMGSGIGLSSSYTPASTVNTSSGIGLGLAGIGNSGSSLDALTRARLAATTQSSSNQISPSGGQMMSGIGGLAQGIGALAAFSDPRLKVDYGKVGKTRTGIDLHMYRFKGESKDAPLRLGVMADEVRKVNPKAVHRHDSGFDVVDYAGIGL